MDKKNKFTIRMQRKLVVLFCLVLLAFAGLSVRLILINRDNGDSYKKQVLSQQQYSSTTIPYKRGEILDNKGTKLASSEKVYDLVLDIKQMNNKEDYVEPTIQALEDYFSIDGDQVRAYAQEHPDSQYYVLKKRMSYNEISDYQQMMADTSQKEYNQYVKGIWFEESYKRVYPNSSLASDVIGFTRTDGTGTYGLEEYYNDVLSGVNGRQYGYIDGDDNLQRTTEAAVDGYNVYSTIDATIQGIVEKYLKKYNDENKDSTREGNGAQDAACIVMDVHSGEVLAMASYPTFDLNDTRNPEALIGSKLIDVSGNSTDTVINEEIAASMKQEENNDLLVQNLNALWKNYCINSTYEPGSTMKPFVAAMGLEDGRLKGNESFECTGVIEIGGYKMPESRPADERPHFILAILPFVAVFVCSTIIGMATYLCLTVGCAVCIVCFTPYIVRHCKKTVSDGSSVGLAVGKTLLECLNEGGMNGGSAFLIIGSLASALPLPP